MMHLFRASSALFLLFFATTAQASILPALTSNNALLVAETPDARMASWSAHSLEFPGCTDIDACNYDAGATSDDGSCTYPVQPYLDCDGNCLNDEDGNGVCNSVYIGPFYGDYFDTSNWSAGIPGVPFGGLDGTIPADAFVDVLDSFNPVAVGVNLVNYGTLAGFTGAGIATGSGTIYNEGTLYFMGPLSVSGPLINSGVINGDGGSAEIDVEFPGYIDNLQGVVYAGVVDNGYNIFSCLETFQVSFLAGSAIDNSACGCTDPTACNYDPAHTVEGDEPCTFLGSGADGCTDATACNFDATAVCDDGSCQYPGCTNISACNYDASAGCEDGSCEYLTCRGCVSVAACNYDVGATIDDGSCEYTSCAGCTYITATNYDPLATVDDGSCTLAGPSGCAVDLNGDGEIGSSDLLEVLAQFGTMCE